MRSNSSRRPQKPETVLERQALRHPPGPFPPIQEAGAVSNWRHFPRAARPVASPVSKTGKGEPMASDITLAVGDGARRMTYAELAAVRGISPASAVRLVRRKHWPRQTGNDGIVRVLVPVTEAPKARQAAPLDVPGDKACPGADMSRVTSAPDLLSPGQYPGQSSPDVPGTIRAFESAVEELRATIADLRQRLDHECQRADQAQSRINELHTALADAVGAERIAAADASALRVIVDGLRARPWWRRWFR